MSNVAYFVAIVVVVLDVVVAEKDGGLVLGLPPTKSTSGLMSIGPFQIVLSSPTVSTVFPTTCIYFSTMRNCLL